MYLASVTHRKNQVKSADTVTRKMIMGHVEYVAEYGHGTVRQSLETNLLLV